MKLLEDIISELVDSQISLSSPLLKTKVLASRTGNQELLSWVNNELMGYSNDSSLPDYRIFEGELIGTYMNGPYQFSNQALPVSAIPEEFQSPYNEFRFTQSIRSLEQLLLDPKNTVVASALSAEAIGVLEYHLRQHNSGNARIQILTAIKRVGSHALTEVLSNVRGQLLDFALQVEKKFGEEVDVKTLKANQAQIVNIMNQTINTSGDGNVINTGNEASITASIKVVKKDKKSFQEALKEQKVSDEDIREIVEIIDTETPSAPSVFGIKVRDWFMKMISKSLDGSWQIAAGAAGGVLTQLINSYYGF